MIRLTAYLGALHFPAECACCLLPTDNRVTAINRQTRNYVVAHVETTSKMAVPYCPKCVDHALWHHEQGIVGMAIRTGSAFAFGAAISALLLMLTYWLLPTRLMSVSMVGGAALLVGLVCATVVGVRRLRREPIGALDDSHATKGPAFFLGEATGAQVALDFANDEYAR